MVTCVFAGEEMKVKHDVSKLVEKIIADTPQAPDVKVLSAPAENGNG